MEITIYGKKKQSTNGQKFVVYLSRLPQRDGTELPVTVRFDETCGKPQQLPCNIVVEKQATHLSSRKYKREDTGETGVSWTFWISAWKPGSDYVDHSMDNIAFD